VPELPEVEAARRELAPAMAGARFAEVVTRRDNLRAPFPPSFAERLRGQTVRSVDRRGKYLVALLSSGDVLLMHLGMSGSFRVERRASAPDRHDHVVFRMSSGAVVTFNDPRRFGLMDLVAMDAPERDVLAALGPEPLSRAFDAAALARAVAGRRTPLKVALLDQRVVAGVGNIYASEALHLAGLSPRRPARSIVTRTGAPRPEAVRLAAAIKTVLRRAIRRTARGTYRGARFRVYDREGEPCWTKGCTGTIRRITQAGRSTFYCPKCQR
jgi:formamidopyrimidine-DNA glycosylase